MQAKASTVLAGISYLDFLNAIKSILFQWLTNSFRKTSDQVISKVLLSTKYEVE